MKMYLMMLTTLIAVQFTLYSLWYYPKNSAKCKKREKKIKFFS